VANREQSAFSASAWNGEDTSRTVTFSSTPTEGSLLVVAVTWRPDMSVSQPSVSGFTKVAETVGGFVGTAIFVKKSAGNETNITASFGTDGTRMVVLAVEYSGDWPETLQFDGNAATGSGNNNSQSSTEDASSYGLALAVLGVRANTGEEQPTIASPFTRFLASGQPSGVGEIRGFLADRAVVSGSVTSNWTWGGTGTTNAGGILLVYEADTGGGDPDPSTEDPELLDVVISEDSANLAWSAPILEGHTHADIFRRGPYASQGSVPTTPFDPENDTRIDRVSAGTLTYQDTPPEPGWYAWQVFPVKLGS